MLKWPSFVSLIVLFSLILRKMAAIRIVSEEKRMKRKNIKRKGRKERCRGERMRRRKNKLAGCRRRWRSIKENENGRK